MVPSLRDWAILAAGGLAHRVDAAGVASLLGRGDWRRIATARTIYVDY